MAPTQFVLEMSKSSTSSSHLGPFEADAIVSLGRRVLLSLALNTRLKFRVSG